MNIKSFIIKATENLRNQAFNTIQQLQQSEHSMQLNNRNNPNIKCNSTIETIQAFNGTQQSQQSEHQMQLNNYNNPNIQYDSTIETIRTSNATQQSQQSEKSKETQ